MVRGVGDQSVTSSEAELEVLTAEQQNLRAQKTQENPPSERTPGLSFVGREFDEKRVVLSLFLQLQSEHLQFGVVYMLHSQARC